ncbi:probable mediator of RNA polymerase II transcription subunit 19b isoform X1 [Ricinus communis]|uniref:probable mediator of RNA polymerase II transcription subunit 19b isoform X1 n=1 Tax=Ricinus communis TaxID=3988 RepID=UPI00201B1FAB|nr:probable mediator of RNA polymerase II transcription subunit 19b isoform X1 [Ricinus communis]
MPLQNCIVLLAKRFVVNSGVKGKLTTSKFLGTYPISWQKDKKTKQSGVVFMAGCEASQGHASKLKAEINYIVLLFIRIRLLLLYNRLIYPESELKLVQARISVLLSDCLSHPVIDEDKPALDFLVKLMGFEGKKFGGGLKELCGAVDLVNQFKLWPHHEFFCKRSLPLSVSQTHYIQNVVGDTEIRKGEGMELDQLFHNTPYMRQGKAHIHTFDLGVLREAFWMRDSTPIDLSSVEKGMPIPAMKATDDSTKDKEMKHRMHKNKNKDHNKNKHHNDDQKHRKRSRIELGPEI